MLEIIHSAWNWILSYLQWILGLLFTNVFAIIGFVLALVIIVRIFREQRRPSSILAWSFFIILIPYLGVPLYVIFGGRKLKKKINAKGFLSVSQNPSLPGKVQDRFEVSANRVAFITDSHEAYKQYTSAIDSAQQEIHILTYILGNDPVGNSILEHLTRKAQQGIRVRLLVDALGSFWRPNKKIKELKAAGGEVCSFMPALPFQTHGWANLRNHRKIAVFDNSKAILGGRNLDERFMAIEAKADAFKDFGAIYEGPVVPYLNGIF